MTKTNRGDNSSSSVSILHRQNRQGLTWLQQAIRGGATIKLSVYILLLLATTSRQVRSHFFEETTIRGGCGRRTSHSSWERFYPSRNTSSRRRRRLQPEDDSENPGGGSGGPTGEQGDSPMHKINENHPDLHLRNPMLERNKDYGENYTGRFPGPKGKYFLCATYLISTCDKLLQRNTYDTFILRKQILIDSGKATEEEFENAVDTISVVFHSFILPEDEQDTQQGVSNETVDIFMSTLNYGFRNSGFNFTLLNITTTTSEDYYYCEEEYYMKQDTHAGTLRVLNIWLCDTRRWYYVGKSTYPNLGEKYPFNDGIVLLNPDIPRDEISSETIYWNLVHQAGHWLGLTHPWTGGCHKAHGTTETSPVTVKARGDGVLDTPPQKTYTWFKRGSDNCYKRRARRGRPVNTCRQHYDLKPDAVDNYMQWIPHQCMEKYGEFSSEQLDRMAALFQEYRLLARDSPVNQFSPERRRIIEICLNEAIEICGCETECLKRIGEDANNIVGLGASDDIFGDDDDDEGGGLVTVSPTATFSPTHSPSHTARPSITNRPTTSPVSGMTRPPDPGSPTIRPTNTRKPTATAQPTQRPTVVPTGAPSLTGNPTEEVQTTLPTDSSPTHQPTILPTATGRPTGPTTSRPTREPGPAPGGSGGSDGVSAPMR